MAYQMYRLILVLRVAGSNTGPTLQMCTITSDTAREAVKVAKLYAARIPSRSMCAAMLAEVMGKIIWQEGDWSQKTGEPYQMLPQKRVSI